MAMTEIWKKFSFNEVQFSERNIQVYRLLCLVGAIIQLVLRLFSDILYPSHEDPYFFRLLLALLLFSTFLLSYSKFQEFFYHLVHFNIYLLFFNELLFAWVNHFTEYYMFTIIVLVLILAYLFPSRIMLVGFLTTTFTSIVLMIFSLPEVTNQHLVLIYSLAGASIFIYVMNVERFRVVKELFKSQDILEATFHESTDAIILAEVDTHKIVAFNSSTQRFLDKCKEKSQKNPICSTLMNKILNERDFSQIPVLNEEIELNICKDHSIWVDSIIKQIKVGEKPYFLIRLTDISIRHEVEKKTIEMEERRKEFMETVSHELRTPLTSIRGFTEILQLRGDYLKPQEKKQCFNFINKNLFRLERLIQDVSEIYKIERGGFELDKRRVNFSKFLHNEFKGYKTLLGNEISIIIPTY